MYRTVKELTKEEFAELRASMFYAILDKMGTKCPYAFPCNIPNEEVYKAYAGVSFTEDDFFCNKTEESEEEQEVAKTSTITLDTLDAFVSITNSLLEKFCQKYPDEYNFDDISVGYDPHTGEAYPSGEEIDNILNFVNGVVIPDLCGK